jgi:hypothetical protein
MELAALGNGFHSHRPLLIGLDDDRRAGDRPVACLGLEPADFAECGRAF